MRHLILSALAVLLFSGTCFSQGARDVITSRASTAAYYNFSKPGDVTVSVNVWGTVRFPGRYELTRGSTLRDVVSLAGGPSDASVTVDRFDRSIHVSLSREGIDSRQIIYESDLSGLVGSGMAMPVLQDDDVVYVQTFIDNKINWANLVLPLANLAAVSLLIVIRVIDLQRR